MGSTALLVMKWKLQRECERSKEKKVSEQVLIYSMGPFPHAASSMAIQWLSDILYVKSALVQKIPPGWVKKLLMTWSKANWNES